MRSVLYNFKNYFKEKIKITYLLSEKAVLERVINVRLLLQKYASNYRKNKISLNLQRDQEEEVLMILKNNCDDYNYDEINKLYAELR